MRTCNMHAIILDLCMHLQEVLRVCSVIVGKVWKGKGRAAGAAARLYAIELKYVFEMCSCSGYGVHPTPHITRLGIFLPAHFH